MISGTFRIDARHFRRNYQIFHLPGPGIGVILVQPTGDTFFPVGGNVGSSIFLTIGALVMLGLFMLSANGLISDNLQAAETNEYYLTALSLAQSVIDEAKTKSFDQVTVSTVPSSPSVLTSPLALGTDGGEAIAAPDTAIGGTYLSISRFNDVDDYNGYVRRSSTARATEYVVTATVTYADPLAPDSALGAPSFCKRLTVTVTSAYLPGPVTLQHAFVY